jgi:transcriptional regulator with XRE-family HTH domain
VYFFERAKLFAQKRICRKATLKSTPACFVATFSRVENGHTIPSIQTLQRWAKVLDVALYRLFFEDHSEVLKLAKSQDWGSGKDTHAFGQFRKVLRRIKKERDLKLVLFMAQKMYQNSERNGRKSKT